MEALLDSVARKLGFDTWAECYSYVMTDGHEQEGIHEADKILGDLRTVIRELDRHHEQTASPL